MPVIKLRGLPWSVSNEDILKFLHGMRVSSNKNTNQPLIHIMTNADGRPSGECFVELDDEQDLEKAIKKNNALMGHRYIEVFRSNFEQLSRHLDQSNRNTQSWHDPVVRLRGLPYGCVKKEISQFFTGLNIVDDGIMMVIDFTGRFNGEAFVTFETFEDALNALDKHREKISNRYIEVFRSTFDELNHYASNAAANRASKRNELKLKNFNTQLRHKPYSSTKPRQHQQQPQSLNQFSYDEDNFDNLESNFFNYDMMTSQTSGSSGRNPAKNPSYICENNHRHYINIANPFNNSNSSHRNINNEEVDYVEEDEDEDEDEAFKYGIKMRGLPFSSTEEDVRKFFEPLMPINIILLSSVNGRPSGECEVYFISHNQACEAMKYDKKFIGNRYIELFLLSGSMCALSSHQTHSKAKSSVLSRRQRTLNRCSFSSSTSSGNFAESTPPPLMSRPELVFAEMAQNLIANCNLFKQNYQTSFNNNNNTNSFINSNSNRRF